MIRLRNINRVELLNNHVLVKISGGTKPLKLPGTELTINTTFNPEKHVDVVGTVVKLPEKLRFYSRKHGQFIGAMMWGTTMELKKHDTVYMDYLEVLSALGVFFNPMANYDNSKFIITPGNDLYVMVHYSKIYVRVKHKGLIPINGNIILRAEDNIKLPGWAGDSRVRPFFEVLYIGKPNEYYILGKAVDADIQPGQLVYFKTLHPVVLEYDLHRKLKERMFVVQRRDIIAVRHENKKICATRPVGARDIEDKR